jgi:hypothetical protein
VSTPIGVCRDRRPGSSSARSRAGPVMASTCTSRGAPLSPLSPPHRVDAPRRRPLMPASEVVQAGDAGHGPCDVKRLCSSFPAGSSAWPVDGDAGSPVGRDRAGCQEVARTGSGPSVAQVHAHQGGRRDGRVLHGPPALTRLPSFRTAPAERQRTSSRSAITARWGQWGCCKPATRSVPTGIDRKSEAEEAEEAEEADEAESWARSRAVSGSPMSVGDVVALPGEWAGGLAAAIDGEVSAQVAAGRKAVGDFTLPPAACRKVSEQSAGSNRGSRR